MTSSHQHFLPVKNAFLLLALLLRMTCFAQTTEFEQFPNGLIYSDAAVSRLKYIADSLNLKFKVCDLNKNFYSKLQGRAHFVEIQQGDLQSAVSDMESGMPFEAFIQKHACSKMGKDLLVLRWGKNTYGGKDGIVFQSLILGNPYSYSLMVPENTVAGRKLNVGVWLYEFHEKTEYAGPYIEAFYVVEPFEQQVFPQPYARMIQYVDCVVDTSAQIFSSSARASDGFDLQETGPRMKEFFSYVNDATEKPSDKMLNKKKFWKKYSEWYAQRIERIDNTIAKEEKFQTLLKEALAEALANKRSSEEFEEYVERYHSKTAALELKRNRKVSGTCSFDDSPRIHSLHIAKLAAETTNWDIFLRAHLNIMNDRFDRMSDGSYAWGRRGTYVRELEILDIDVPNLLFGISLTADNTANGHYYGAIRRLGRTLAESSRASDMETRMLEMIADNSLDPYNRIMMYYLFLNYNECQENKEKQAESREKLKLAVATLPEYLSARITKF